MDNMQQFGPLPTRAKQVRRGRFATALILCMCLLSTALASRGHATESVVYSFAGGNDGAGPEAGLIVDQNGVFYGTTAAGGGTGCAPQSAGCGTAFSLTPPATPGGTWTETVLHSFVGEPDGAAPKAALLAGKGGVLYGATSSGGASNAGIVFELTPPSTPGGPWTESILYSFTGGVDGS